MNICKMFKYLLCAALCAATIAGSLPVTQASAAQYEGAGLLVHTDWNFKLYNSFDKFPAGYTLTKGTDLSYNSDGGSDMDVSLASSIGYTSTTALSVKINTNANQSFNILPTDNNGYKTDFTGAKEFWIWVDTTNMATTFRKVFFGVLASDGKTYQTDDLDGRADMTYYMQNSNGDWVEKHFDTDGCMEDIGNYKGFIRFSTNYFVNDTTNHTPVDLSKVTGIKVWYDLNGNSGGEGESFAVDHIGFAGPSIADKDCNVGDFSSNGTMTLPSQMPAVNFDSSNIKLTYGAISDLHISNDTTGNAATKVTNALSQLNAKAKSDNSNLDAVFAAGDLTDYGKPEMFSNLATIIKGSLNLTNTRFIAALGNHDYYNNTINGATRLGGNWLVDAFGGGDTGKNLVYPGATDTEIQNADYHTTVKGYDFIVVNCANYDGGVKYNQDDLDWLKQQLASAAAAHPDQPIFVASHPTITGTTYVGNHAGAYYNSTDLYSIFQQYPQVIYFSGHTHYNLNDEKDIWQGDFTTVGTAAVYYGCVDTYDDDGDKVYGVNGDDPADYDQFSQGLYVQVDGNNNVKLTRMDFYHGKEIKTAWVIPAPKADKSNLKYYTNLRRLDNSAPNFDAGATVKLDKADLDKGSISLTFSAASDDDMVKGYLISFIDKSTGRTIKRIPVYSDFYEYPQAADMPKSLSFTFSSGALAPFTADYEKDYTIQVAAFDSWNAKSASISSDTIPGTPADPARNQNKAGPDFHGDWNFKLFNDFNTFPVGYNLTVDSAANPNGDYNGWPAPSDSSVSQEPVQNNGYKNTAAITSKIKSNASEYTVYFPTNDHKYKTNFTGAKEFWVWVDFSNVTFRKIAFGVRTAKYGSGIQYTTDDYDGQTNMNAYIQDGTSGGWKAVNFDTDGCLEQFGNYKGFIRFPISYLHCGEDELNPENIQAFYLWMSPSSDAMTGKTFTFDEVGFAGPTMDDNDGTLNTTVSENSNGSDGNSDSSNTSKTYQAVVSGAGMNNSTLPVSIDMASGNAKVNLGTQQGNVFTDGGTSVIKVPSIPGVNNYSIEIPASLLIGSEHKGSLTFSAETGSLTIPDNMLTGISGISGKLAVITIREGDKSNLADDVKAEIGDRPLMQITLTVDGNKTEWNNPDAPVTVSIPYTPTAAELEKPESIVIWYIDGNGKAVSVPSGHYDSATGTVTFTTTHFSDYAVGFNKVDFNDVAAGKWYSKAVGFIAARGIAAGTGNGNYSPDVKLTRGEFIVTLMRAYGITPDASSNDNFSDAGNTYYTEYLAKAKKLGISNGIGSNLFAPNREITRQEMFTLLCNALKAIGQLPEGTAGKSLSDYSDSEKIASWAKDALTLLVQTGVIHGNNGKLFPTDTTTRGEMAQVLYNLLSK